MSNISSKAGRIVPLMIVLTVLLGCKKKNIDFSYSPAEPRAGEIVKFTNTSDTGEEWAWTFGDGTTSSSKSPQKTYKQPGRYTVILKVDDKKSLTKTRDITIYDTIPNFSSSIVDSIGVGIYEDVTFKALVYNPYSLDLTYYWTISDESGCVVNSKSNTEETFECYFIRAGKYNVRMEGLLGEQQFMAQHTYEVKDKPAEGLLMQVGEQAYRQRIYGVRRSEVVETEDAECLRLLSMSQDTMQIYNDSVFLLRDLQAVLGSLNCDGFRIARRKMYIRSESNGLFIVNFDGTGAVQIDDKPVFAIREDIVDNRIYWAVADSVMYMPLVETPYNTFTTEPKKLNDMQGVTRLAKDNNNR